LIDWKLLASTFGAIFLAELGDKTQLATFGIAAAGRAKLSVFLGAAAALIATSAIAVLVGGSLSRVVPEEIVKRAAGVLFVGIGLFYLFGKG
jgi:putative Ca2+/H+ antiporter (TMEM165/GDT1 family)